MKLISIAGLCLGFILVCFLIWIVWHVKIMRDVTGNDIKFNLKYFLLAEDKTRPFKATGKPSVVFIHHSVGENLCNQGIEAIPPARILFAKHNIDFYSHNYNHFNNNRPLQFPDGSYHVGYNIPWDSTDPEGLAYLFSQKTTSDSPDGLFGNAFSRALAHHDVIVGKSCYSASDIKNDDQLEKYKKCYLKMKDVCRKHPDKIFIMLTPPPRNNRIKPEFAEYNARAVTFSRWLAGDDYVGNVPNLYVWDFGGYLREPDPMSPDYNGLKREYQISEMESHPNEKANRYLRPKFVEFVITVIQKYRNARR